MHDDEVSKEIEDFRQRASKLKHTDCSCESPMVCSRPPHWIIGLYYGEMTCCMCYEIAVIPNNGRAFCEKDYRKSKTITTIMLDAAVAVVGLNKDIQSLARNAKVLEFRVTKHLINGNDIIPQDGMYDLAQIRMQIKWIYTQTFPRVKEQWISYSVLEKKEKVEWPKNYEEDINL